MSERTYPWEYENELNQCKHQLNKAVTLMTITYNDYFNKHENAIKSNPWQTLGAEYAQHSTLSDIALECVLDVEKAITALLNLPHNKKIVNAAPSKEKR